MKRYFKHIPLLLSALIIFNSCDDLLPTGGHTDKNELKNDSISKLLISDIRSDSIQSSVEWLQGMGTRYALSPDHRNVALKVRDRFRRLGYIDAYLDSFYLSISWRSVPYAFYRYNVVAELRGSESPDSLMVLGAHYDDILSAGDPSARAPGANDNASGVAAMLEVARVMKKAGYRPANTIRFVAFDAEEEGLFGSFAYASKLVTSGYSTKLMVNNDMIGVENSASKTNWYVRVMHYRNSDDITSRATNLCGRYCYITPALDTVYNKRSDSYPFYLNSIKTIFFTSGSTDNNYHTLNDLSTNCNFEYCAQVTRISCALLVYSDQKQY